MVPLDPLPVNHFRPKPFAAEEFSGGLLFGRIIRSRTIPGAEGDFDMAGMPSQLVRRVLLAGERLRRCLDQSYMRSELNGPRVDVLETIASAGPEGCSQTELATELGAAESSVSTIIERMRRDGLLLRMRSRQDRRCSVLLLTEVGSERLASVMQSRDRHLSQWINRLSITEQQQLCEALDRLLDVLSENPLSETAPGSDTSGKWGKAA